MRVLHVAYGYPPDPPGGTELYVEALARHLLERGWESSIAAPADADSAYVYNDIPVRRFGVDARIRDIRELYGHGDATAASGFASIVKSEKPDIVHLHASSPAVSVRLVRVAKQQGVPVVFTYHTPTVTCIRGTLLQWGREVCDGKLEVVRCSQCVLHGRTGNASVSILLGSLPPALGGALGTLRRSGGAWTALRMSDLVRLHHATLCEFFSTVDQVVVLCDWAKAVMLRNNVPNSKVVLSRHGLFLPPPNYGSAGPTGPGVYPPLRVAFLGRSDPAKGAHVLVKALQLAPDLPIELDLYGIVQDSPGATYLQELVRRASGDSRVRFIPPIPHQRVLDVLRTYHILAVPSMVLETGPMVVLEAFAAGLPVVGSNLGGISELVRDGENGLLVKPGEPHAWVAALTWLVGKASRLQRLRSAIRPPRQMAAVAQEMSAVYAQLINEAHLRTGERAPGDIRAPF